MRLRDLFTHFSKPAQDVVTTPNDNIRVYQEAPGDLQSESDEDPESISDLIPYFTSPPNSDTGPETSTDKIAKQAIESCSICASIKASYYHETLSSKEENLYRYSCFHESCERCSDLRKATLCETCQHMRVRHVFRCSNSMGYRLHMTFGSFEEVQERSKTCELCRMFVRAVAEDRVPPHAQVEISLQQGDREYFSNTFKVILKITTEGHSMDNPGYNWGYEWTGYTEKPTRDIIKWAKQPRPPKKIDWVQVSKWIQDCDEHPNCHVKPTGQQPAGFRLIDTQRGCIVIPPPRCLYATLSYVWGNRGNSDLQLTVKTLAQFTKKNILFRDTVPLTIRDAITAWQKLGIRYLWIDRLCIVQDDEENKMAQINAMGDIYGNSYITLAALQGHDAQHGLPGVSKNRNTSQMSCSINETFFVKRHQSFQELFHESKWASRGWTFQEALLSRRLLSFSDKSIFYECGHHYTLQMEDKSALAGDVIDRDMVRDRPFYEKVRSFTRRDLSFESDILRAFTGVLASLYGSNHYFGLPFAEFHSAIRWQTKDARYIPRQPPQGAVFPSWSWVSVKGEIEIPRREDEWDTFAASLALWAVPSDSPDAKLHFIHHTHDCSPDSGFSGPRALSADYQRSPTIALIKAWMMGCYGGRLPEELNVDTTWSGYKRILESPDWRSLERLADAALGLKDGNLSEDNIERLFDNARVAKARQIGGTLVHTQSLRVQVLLPSREDGLVADIIKLKTPAGDIIGWLHSNATNQSLLYTMCSHSPGRVFDALALCLIVKNSDQLDSEEEQMTQSVDDDELVYWRDSEGERLHMELCIATQRHFTQDERLTPDSFGRRSTEEERQIPNAFLADLMIVDTDESTGVSRRVGIGRAFLGVWVKASPQFNTFVIG